MQIRPARPEDIDFHTLQQRLEKQNVPVTSNPYLLSFETDGKRMVMFKDGRVLIHGTKDIAQAKAFYQRYRG